MQSPTTTAVSSTTVLLRLSTELREAPTRGPDPGTGSLGVHPTDTYTPEACGTPLPTTGAVTHLHTRVGHTDTKKRNTLNRKTTPFLKSPLPFSLATSPIEKKITLPLTEEICL